MATRVYQIRLKDITAGVEVVDGVVTDSAPVFRKFIGAQLVKLRAWVMGKGGTIRCVHEEQP